MAKKKPKGKEITTFTNGILNTEREEAPAVLSARRVRAFCVITYIHEEAVIRFLKMSKWVQHWALCPHDKDLNADGSPKADHIHVLLYTFNQHTSSAVQKNFDRYAYEIYKYTEYEPQNTFADCCENMVSQYRYLIHQDDPDKYQYNPIHRKTDSDYYWWNLESTSGMNSVIENKGMAIVNDIVAGSSERDLVARYGNVWIWHRPQYLQSARQIIREEVLRKEHQTNNIIDLILEEHHPLSSEVVKNFYIVLDYIKTECLLSYNSQLDFYLKEKNENG